MFSTEPTGGIVSLYSSTGTDPLFLWSSHTDESLPEDSFICHINDKTSSPAPTPPAALIAPLPLDENAYNTGENSNGLGYALDQNVLHIQSPTLPATYIRCPSVNWPPSRVSAGIGAAMRQNDLGLKHPWMHIQTEPKLKFTTPPLLHLPLAFPPASSRPLTAWSTVNLNITSLLPHFSSSALSHSNDDDEEEDTAQEEHITPSSAPLPGPNFMHVSDTINMTKAGMKHCVRCHSNFKGSSSNTTCQLPHIFEDEPSNVWDGNPLHRAACCGAYVRLLMDDQADICQLGDKVSANLAESGWCFVGTHTTTATALRSVHNCPTYLPCQLDENGVCVWERIKWDESRPVYVKDLQTYEEAGLRIHVDKKDKADKGKKTGVQGHRKEREHKPLTMQLRERKTQGAQLANPD
ncbi:hypothetical protein EW146_g2308 [Bondarzewia mesenterica]|uniref:Uncharacterized protein n=1 Tax=Bondarzewia mesenterica TaxID=1095465 RepID=A0A4S4M1I3_9AGAM|nr:hypothetical protein EW146_g2308 [Bondarzewia mesenterica]